VAMTRTNKRKPKCARTIASLSFANLPAGATRVVFDGRVSRSKKLKPGLYTLVITAINAAGQRSAPALLRFTIVKR
jgi:hypothetical protein